MIPICIDDVSPQASGLAEELQGNGRVYAPLLPDYKWPWTGAERVMSAEAKYLQGKTSGHADCLWKTPMYTLQITDRRILLCCDFLAYRLSVGLESVHGKKL